MDYDLLDIENIENLKMPRKISRKEWNTLKNIVLYGTPTVFFAVGLRELVLENFNKYVTQIDSSLGVMLFGLVWLLVVYYFRKKK